MLLSFSAERSHDDAHVIVTCHARLISQASNVISAVLLEHSPCADGGVSVLLLDNSTHRRWDVCSSWHAPGPDFTSNYSVADVNIELADVINPFNVTISVRAVNKGDPSEIEMRYFSATEGTSVCLPGCPYVGRLLACFLNVPVTC